MSKIALVSTAIFVGTTKSDVTGFVRNVELEYIVNEVKAGMDN